MSTAHVTHCHINTERPVRVLPRRRSPDVCYEGQLTLAGIQNSGQNDTPAPSGNGRYEIRGSHPTGSTIPSKHSSFTLPAPRSLAELTIYGVADAVPAPGPVDSMGKGSTSQVLPKRPPAILVIGAGRMGRSVASFADLFPRPDSCLDGASNRITV